MVADHLIDTDIMIDLLRGDSKALGWLSSTGYKFSYISSIVWMECVQGANNLIERGQIIKFLRGFRVVHFELADSFWSMQQFARLHLGHGIGIEDTMIGAVAVRLNVPIYTKNTKHYQILPNIQVIRPY